MKTRRSPLFLLILPLLCLLLLPIRVSAAEASLTGEEQVRAGDTITLTFKLECEKTLALNSLLTYDESHLTLQRVDSLLPASWVLETAGNVILAYDNDQTSPLSGKIPLLTATFRVSESIEEGTNLTISMTEIVTSDGKQDAPVSNATYRVTIGAPPSSDAALSSLSADGVAFQPDFDPNVTKYTANVPYSMQKLDLDLETRDDAASFRVSESTLAVGENTITIRVTAEDGTTKTYTLTVTRAQDPNYKPSSDTAFSQIALSTGTLSPTFTPDVREYVLYVPYETTSVTFSPTMRDEKGKTSPVNVPLVEGSNEVFLPGTAEDGSEGRYRVLVVRLPIYSVEEGPIWPPAQTSPPETDPPATTPPPETDPPATSSPDTSGAPETSPPSDTETTAQVPPPAASESASPLPVLLAGLVGVLLGGGAVLAFGGKVRIDRRKG